MSSNGQTKSIVRVETRSTRTGPEGMEQAYFSTAEAEAMLKLTPSWCAGGVEYEDLNGDPDGQHARRFIEWRVPASEAPGLVERLKDLLYAGWPGEALVVHRPDVPDATPASGEWLLARYRTRDEQHPCDAA